MSELTWRQWAGQVATGMALVDADLRVRWLNPALAETLALGARSVVGQPLGVLLADVDAVAQAGRVLAEQRPLQWRGMALSTPGDRTINADIAVQPFDDGLLLEVHALAEPVAARSPLSATLRGFAHEVKNPLAGLRGAAQLLQRRVDGEDLQALAGMIIDEADRLGALANRLLFHDGAARLALLNIHHLLERLGDLLQAEPAAPRLRHDYDPSAPELLGDADRLQQVLLNLARNALQAGAKQLTFRTRVEHGVRLGERVLLFEPLVSGRADGTGLGLALSREIAQEHGGDLRYTSYPGETVFSLYLPLEKAHGR